MYAFSCSVLLSLADRLSSGCNKWNLMLREQNPRNRPDRKSLSAATHLHCALLCVAGKDKPAKSNTELKFLPCQSTTSHIIDLQGHELYGWLLFSKIKRTVYFFELFYVFVLHSSMLD